MRFTIKALASAGPRTVGRVVFTTVGHPEPRACSRRIHGRGPRRCLPVTGCPPRPTTMAANPAGGAAGGAYETGAVAVVDCTASPVLTRLSGDRRIRAGSTGIPGSRLAVEVDSDGRPLRGTAHP